MIRPARILIALSCLSTAAYAHHSMDLRDATPIRVEGDIEFVSWDGAHVVYDIRGTDASGELRTWAVMGASPKILRKRGIAKATFKIGDRITVNFEHAGKVLINATKITLQILDERDA